MKRAVDFVGGRVGLAVMAVVGLLCLLVLGQAIIAFADNNPGLGVAYLVGILILLAGGVVVARMIKKDVNHRDGEP
jgi:hypothetical protein